MEPDAYLAGAYLEVIEHEADRLAAVVEDASGRAVPSCPGWTVAELAVHLGTIHRWAAATVQSRARAPIADRDRRFAVDAHGAELADWLRDGAHDLVGVLLECPLEQPVWSWVPDGTAMFWRRRQAHETAVHRWDAEDAIGAPHPFEPRLASDGVDEWLHVFAAGRSRPSSSREGSGESFHFHCTDTEGEWTVRFSGAGVEVRAEHERADVAVHGSASDLLLFIWGRRPTMGLEVLGDAALFHVWNEYLPAI